MVMLQIGQWGLSAINFLYLLLGDVSMRDAQWQVAHSHSVVHVSL